MAKIQIPNFLEKLQSATPITFRHVEKPPPGSLSAPRVVETVIPPINTDIRLEKYLPRYSISLHPHVKGLAEAKTPLPDRWDWRHIYPEDSALIKKMKSIITLPANQAMCGSCWAFNSADIISDNFIVQGLVNHNPNISATYFLICFPQHQCGGGNPGLLMKTLEKHGAVTQNCIDYSWCLTNPKCSGEGVKHLTHPKPKELNNLLPKKCGCYLSTHHYMYHIKHPQVLIAREDSHVPMVIQTVKYHILKYGPVGGTYIVPKNFVHGNYAKSNGVYLEYVDYGSSNTYFTPNKQAPKILGAHLISIMGWGVEHNVKYLDKEGKERVGDVPYWYCRNSWKPTWGVDGGYWKHAMYPYNQLAQFSRQIQINGMMNGGIVTIQAAGSKKMTFDDLHYMGKLLQNKSFYQDSPEPGAGLSIKSPRSTKHTTRKWVAIGIGAAVALTIVILAIVYGIKWSRKSKRFLHKLRYPVETRPTYPTNVRPTSVRPTYPTNVRSRFSNVRPRNMIYTRNIYE